MLWHEYLIIIFGTGILGSIIQLFISNYFTIKAVNRERQKQVYNHFLDVLQNMPSNSDANSLIITRNNVLLYSHVDTADYINDYVNRLVRAINNNDSFGKEEQDEAFVKIINYMRKDLA